MINKGLILKTAAVVSAVSVLIITGCQGGNKETAAVNNKSVVKETSIVSKKDREENIETVVRSNGLKGQDTEDLRNDNEREAASDRRVPEVTVEVKPLKDESGDAGEEDIPTGTDDNEGQSDESVLSVYESDSSAGWDGGMENDSAVSEYWDGDAVSDDGYYDSGVDESGQPDSTESAVSEPEVPVQEYEESGDGWEYYTTARITFYDSGPCCCGSFASGFTASGEPAIVGWTCANGALPFGTMVLIDGQEYCVTDRGVGTDEFDILVSTHDEALERGMYYADVYVRW